MRKYSIPLFANVLWFFSICNANAQDSNAPGAGVGIETSFISARVIRHEAKFTAPIPPISFAQDVNFVYQTYGRKDWEQRRRFPVIGIGFTYTDYGDNAVFGHCYGIYPNMQVPLLRRQNMEWTLRFGDGLGYVTRKYQTSAPVDTINNAIGSHLNDFAMLMTDLRFNIDDHWRLQFGLTFTHISDADVRQPNLGVNMGGIHAGAQYYPVTYRPKRIIRDLSKLPNRWLIEARAGTAYNESRSPGNPELPSYMGSAYASRRWKGKNKVFIGADYAFHNDVEAFLKWCNLYRGHEGAHSWDGAVFAGNEFLMGRVGIMTQIGIYYHQTYLAFDPFYEKFGINYYLLQKEHGPIKELFLSAMLLAHEITAQYAEFGIGTGF
jgi:Lipid A 3-O-deacylase (PagL)